MNDKQWYIIKTNPRAEKRVAERLEKLNIDHFLPLRKELKIWHDRNKFVEEVLFKNYLFVFSTEQNRNNVFEVSGIVRYLFDNGKIATLTQKEIDRIKIFCNLDKIKIETNNFEEGEEVEIIKGELIGLRGILIEKNKKQKLKIFISQLGCFATIGIDQKDVRKI